jgi:hypothetical protein
VSSSDFNPTGFFLLSFWGDFRVVHRIDEIKLGLITIKI